MAADDVQLGKDVTFTIGGANVANAEDVNVNKSVVEADTTRRSSDIESSKPVLKSIEVSFTLQAREGDPIVTVLKTAYDNRTKVAVVVGTNSKNAYVTQFNEGYPMKDKVTYDVTLKFTDEGS